MLSFSSDFEPIVKDYLASLFAKCSSQASSNLIMDFTQVFKHKISRASASPASHKENLAIALIKPEDLPQSAAQHEIPRSLTVTQTQMRGRKCMDTRRWLCMARPQYSKSCGITSLVSCWNYLYSTLGTGTLPPVSQEEAMVLLGFNPPFGEIRFGPFTGNHTLIQWFGLLNKHFNVKGEARHFWKMHGGSRTEGVDQAAALKGIEDELQKERSAFIYHCYNHYCCPIGFEITPTKPPNAYKVKEQIPESEADHWIIIGEPSKCYPVFHVKKWDEVAMDISNQYPEYYNMRKPQNLGKNCHCLLIFSKTN